ncbi:histidine kinase [Kineosporia rhizophila]|uniref:sensor histidine kinase n=1 Tax=Kineosporia TaxID=49184 RepID=UPI001E2B05DF|nr:histidine kinase [Kineosporia sp. NBRC 101677]MCE0539583.1 histidine kinase [Kineosporia rhizophila]
MDTLTARPGRGATSRRWAGRILRGAGLLAVFVVVVGSFGPNAMVTTVLLLGSALYLQFSRPVTCWAVTVAMAPLLATWYSHDEGVTLLSLASINVAVAVLAWRRTWRVSLPALLVSAVVQGLLFAWQMNGIDLAQAAPVVLLVLLVVWLVANSAGDARRRAVAARLRETELAIEAERLRIAREMHDLIAHSLGAIAFQAGMGSRVIETQPAEARNALSAIEGLSRQTLAELRRTLAALRRADPEGAPMAPAPGLGDLGRLVGTAREAGVAVEVERLGAVRDLPGDLELSAFRIVQESVTNVIRHAATPRCLVRLDFTAEELAIEVLDEGRGSAEAGGAGYGLVGMRERAVLLGGQFSAAPRAEGGFRVSARLPIPASG